MDCHVSKEAHLSDEANDDDGSKVEYPALQRLWIVEETLIH